MRREQHRVILPRPTAQHRDMHRDTTTMKMEEKWRLICGSRTRPGDSWYVRTLLCPFQDLKLTATTAPFLGSSLGSLPRPRTLDCHFLSGHNPHLPPPQTSSKKLDSGRDIDLPFDLDPEHAATRHLQSSSR